MRDIGALEAALARPQNLADYGDPDVADIAAAYALGIVRGHPFVDGNKRTGAIALEMTLRLNGFSLAVSDNALVAATIALAAGDVGQDGLAAWIRQNLVALRG